MLKMSLRSVCVHCVNFGCRRSTLSLAAVKSRLVLPLWCRLTRVVSERGPLNGCVCVGEVQCGAVRLPGTTESLSVARGGISSSEVSFSSPELAGVHCQEGRIGCVHTRSAGHHHYESHKAGNATD